MFKQGDPAPVPAEALAAALAPFGQSRMLPRESYVDPAVFDWEQHNIFSGWTCVGHASDLAAVGAQKAVGTGPNAILLVRGEDDAVRAFANTCRHRGHELLACNATTKGRAIVCPYHSWSYRLDGRLRNAPGFRDMEGFEPDEFGLAELRLVNWHGWLFVDPSGEDADFATHVAGLDEVVGPYRPEDLTIVARHSYELATNWKVIAENYQECYHCSTIHPELSRISPPTSGENLDLPGSWMGGWMSIVEGAETMSLTGKSGGVAIQGLSEHELRSVMYLVGYPNLLVSLHPDYVMTHSDDAARRRPHPRRVRMGLPERRCRQTGFRSVVRGRLLGSDQQAGLGGVRVGAARPLLTACAARPAGTRRGRRLPVRHAGG